MNTANQGIKRIVVFAPHPDDDIIGCGGSMAKYVEQGISVTVVYMTSGESGSVEYNKEELAKTREQEAKAALETLGIEDCVFLRQPDGYLEYNGNLLIRIVELIREKRPQMIYVPHENDAHNDHKVTFKVVKEAANRAVGSWFQECKGEPWGVGIILTYEVWTPMEDFAYVENITGTMEVKLEALSKHQSQIRDIRYDEGVKGLDRYRGVMTSKGEFCEVFGVVKVDRVI